MGGRGQRHRDDQPRRVLARSRLLTAKPGEATPARRGARSAAREAALHVLFATDATPAGGGDEEPHARRQLEAYWRSRADGGADLEGTLSVAEPEAQSYAEALVLGVTRRLRDVDAAIRKASAHWRLERMARVDRTVLRIGTWELLTDEKAPRAVVIDEAVELGKSYGASESASFVNGVLDRVAQDLGRT